jgi:hypothetical protein
VPNVQWETPDDGQGNCPKHLEFVDKNTFGKLVSLLVLFKITFVNVMGFKLDKVNVSSYTTPLLPCSWGSTFIQNVLADLPKLHGATC